ncbi:hypothetical protein FHJ31_14420 [Pseudomonas sp. Fig-3]|uniref:hypothetical protein n=1 Tax=unclassified Pseudomonas TaxID=196821 RepID=UPI0011127685|nr:MULTISPECIES: hypothetical protein [unclassified Pseudomonas]MDR8386102.1 hypothetical protein [Pseudomonas sp. JL2]TNB84019.1 hypothetical protein FHJ31_14420 [Pseudomonas sp. Fig-3]
MRRIPENFDKLHFTESRLGNPVVEGRTLCIPVDGLLPMMGHPLMDGGPRLLSGRLIFRGVVTSRRDLTEYIGDPKSPDGFKDEYSVEDLPPQSNDSGVCRMYLFEGLFDEPVAWVDWDVLAESFEFVVDE